MKKFVITFIQKTKLFFAASVVLVFVMVILYVVMFSMIKKKTMSYVEMYTVTQSQVDAFNALTNQKKLITDTAESREELARYFINQSSVGSFFEKLEEIAEVANVNFTVGSARLGQVEGEGLQVQISADGTFRSVYHFLALVEHMPFGIEVTTFDMRTNNIDDPSVSAGQPWRGVLDVNVLTYVE